MVSQNTSISSPELLEIWDEKTRFYGADQMWYQAEWRRRAGCGPTACAHIMWYLAQTRPGMGALSAHDGSSRQGFLSIMNDVWPYVTPGMRGVNKTSTFTTGALRYAADRGQVLSAKTCEISPIARLRPEPGAVLEFIKTALQKDLPVAFLNLSNGRLKNLDNWHWVTLVALEGQGGARMFDQGKESVIDLPLWLETTTLGGGFVVLEP